MSGLRDRMNRLRGESSAKEAPPAQSLSAYEGPAEENAESEQLSSDWEAIGVKLHAHETGSFLIRKTVYPADHYHGLHSLGELDAASAGLASFHPGEPYASASERILFLDLETTGLGVGAGNVPFMIGIGYMKNGQYVIEQTIIRHPAEERAMLAYLTEKLADFEFLATYNGKTFDWPLVQSRLIMNGLGRNIWEPKHLDFLHPARSIWRNTLASCRLSHVEEERLGIHRENDVPGSLAPQLYFQFLADGNPAPLEGVFRHNETDMLSLACLAIRFGHLLNGTIRKYIPLPDEPEELVRTGIWLEKMGKHELPGDLYRLAERSEAAKPSTLLTLAARDKKAGNWNRAVLLWQKAVLHSKEHFGASALEASIELAMYYEHKLKDYGSALAYARTAFEHIQQSAKLVRMDAKRRSELDALRNRMVRLNRKREKQLL